MPRIIFSVKKWHPLRLSVKWMLCKANSTVRRRDLFFSVFHERYNNIPMNDDGKLSLDCNLLYICDCLKCFRGGAKSKWNSWKTKLPMTRSETILSRSASSILTCHQLRFSSNRGNIGVLPTNLSNHSLSEWGVNHIQWRCSTSCNRPKRNTTSL